MACKTEDKTRWAKPQEDQTLTSKDSQKTLPSYNSDIITKSAKERLKERKMTKNDRVRALNMKFLIDGLIPSGYHIVLYGAAGSGKTTVALYLCEQILLNHHDAEVFYLFLDGQLAMAAKYEDYLEDKELSERYNIIIEGNADENLTLIENMIKDNELYLINLIIVIDTLKFLNQNILSKSANARVMHRIKALTNKGATFISLHHTNKDGENFAGTAEIEQDSDALLKIETTDGDNPQMKISTIKEGGRVRFFFESKSFKFYQGDPSTVEMLDTSIDAEALSQEKKDTQYVTIIKAILNIEQEITRSVLDKYLKEDDDFDCSNKERDRILKTYKDVHWKVRKGGERNRYHYYSVIDVVHNSIESIKQKLSSP